MQLGGLVASAGINIGLTALFLSLYSIFRKQPGNQNVYFPRYAIRQKNVFKKDRFEFESLVPSTGWIQRALKPSEDELIAASGLDAAILLRIFVFGMRFFGICTIIGIGILAPINYTDNQVTQESKSGLLYDSLDLFTISNISDGSSRLWVHLAALYVISLSAYWLLYMEFEHIVEKRLHVLGIARPQPDQFTVLVRNIRRDNERQSYSECLEEFFRHFHPFTYLSHQMVYRDWKIQHTKNHLDKLARKIDKLKQGPQHERPTTRNGFLGIFGSKVDKLELLSKEFDEQYRKYKESQRNLLNDEKAEMPSAFVSFKSRWGAAVAAQTQQAENPLEFVTDWAPESRDVFWPNLAMPFLLSKIYAVAVGFGVFAIIVLWIIPVGFVQSIAQLDNLQKWLPGVKIILKIPGVRSVITGYLPSLLLSLLLYVVPPIMLFLSRVEGHFSNSIQEREASRKMFWFYVGNTFFITVLSGTLLDALNTILSNPKDIPNQLAVAVPRQATFFVSYVLTTGWTGFSTEILLPSALLLNFFKVRILGDTAFDETDAYSLPYFRALPNVLLFIFVGIMYAVLAPLLLPFLLIYVVFGFIVYRNQVLFVYEPGYESSGQFWTHIHGSIIFALCLMQVTFIGVFGAKRKATASILTIPLPFITLFFDNYCRNRFLPTFKNLSVETTMKKDVDDDRSGLKDELLQNIHDAYKHPALQPVEVGKTTTGTDTELLLPGPSA